LIDEELEDVPDTFDADGKQSDRGQYNLYEGLITDELGFDREIELLLDKSMFIA
jgi:hypothetical protein